MARMQFVGAVLVSVVLLLGVAQGQTFCDCDYDIGTFCQSLEVIGMSQGVSLCEETTFVCDKCYCVEGGPHTCAVKDSTALMFTSGIECEVLPVQYAECPPPTPTPSFTPTPTAVPGPLGWVLSAPGEACNDTCTDAAAPCNAFAISDINGYGTSDPAGFSAFMDMQFGVVCSTSNCFAPECNGPSPFYISSSSVCPVSPIQGLADCGATFGVAQRVCCCGDFADCPGP
mmetsp:Transcript_1041/g.2035  ORF Transcript_1041/g.2035 Transcript_1041/m.2035 type:complete len:229 (-) Transcript_1041:38-724(-)|eukprot:CAMPEP_0185853478 /NCGR_PEP_ID=MMETSP1354-20130828/19179_1 /TAXON_ID=708628 /ORGANISM="Erythrolobus madagascarensis, Strain CCMP3276" /LENGTH=228 /DNA_ID=CAMNT_0028554981 /DNA_START=154 /DNA_END=840 /DNA_ORIENTATION=+